MKSKNKTVVVGMSGGVDSSVAAYLLKEQGYNVVGLFMKNWEETNDKGCCSAEHDFSDVKRVCEVLDIPYYSIDFSRQYMDNVFAHFLDGLKRGITPNPDILCNREIKFGPFLEFADKLGADFIATGHYCKVKDGGLMRAHDTEKDQTYFLCALTPKQLSRVMFPLGGMLKTEVRKIAKKLGLVTSEKKDSTGICFIGERNFRNFMETYLGSQPGDIKTLDGEKVGKHGGLMYYTIGQRKGLGIGGKRTCAASSGTCVENLACTFSEQVPEKAATRWFVVRKDLDTNTLYVNNGDCPELYSKSLVAKNFNWIKQPANDTFECTAKTRYRQPDQECRVTLTDSCKVTFAKPQRAITPGQWVVLYDGDAVLGGGEISEVI